MSEKPQNVQDAFLTHLCERKTAVTVFLMNGIKQQGFVDWFDKFSLILRRDRHSQLIFKHAVATIVPMAAVQLFDEETSPPRNKRSDIHARPHTVANRNG